MKSIVKTVVAAGVVAGSLVFTSCGEKPAEADQTAKTSESDVKPYPLDTCIVSDEELGSMGDTIVINHEGQEIKFCCDMCVPKFKKDPAKYLAKLKK